MIFGGWHRMQDAKHFNDRPAVARCGIAIMAKASTPGRTKTRLVPPLTFAEAAALNTAFLQDIAENVLQAGRHSEIAGYVAFAPRGSEDFFRSILPPTIGLIDACLPTFGDCLLHTVEHLLARGHQSAVVLNSDSPTLPTALLIETAEALARPGERAVLGPSSDGGYYLLGHQNGASPPVRGHRLEHRARRRADARTGPRDQARCPYAAGLV